MARALAIELLIDHGRGWFTHYGYLRRGSVTVEEGQKVVAGQRLGLEIGELVRDRDFLRRAPHHDGLGVGEHRRDQAEMQEVVRQLVDDVRTEGRFRIADEQGVRLRVLGRPVQATHGDDPTYLVGAETHGRRSANAGQDHHVA